MRCAGCKFACTHQFPTSQSSQMKMTPSAQTFSCSGCNITNNSAPRCPILFSERADEDYDDNGVPLPGATQTIAWGTGSRMSGALGSYAWTLSMVAASARTCVSAYASSICHAALLWV